jgi:glyoxylase-like metal-dependent hydrolase (beta-lactamase superfamily II)
MMRLGDVELHSLSDGTFRLDGGAMFGIVPKPLWERRLAADERNRVTLALRCLLIRTGRHTVLVDAGIGDKLSARERDQYGVDRAEHLALSLARAGLTTRDIDVVVATHLHLDHAGGFTTLVDGVLAPTFPHARYVIRRGEWEDATHPHERNRASYLVENFLPLEQAGVIDLIDDDGEVVPGVSVRRTGGHTRHHQIVQVDAGGRRAVFAADLIPTTAHVAAPWIMGYDLYPMETLAFKRRFVREAIAGEYVIFFEHDPVVAAGVIGQDGRRERVEPVRL